MNCLAFFFKKGHYLTSVEKMKRNSLRRRSMKYRKKATLIFELKQKLYWPGTHIFILMSQQTFSTWNEWVKWWSGGSETCSLDSGKNHRHPPGLLEPCHFYTWNSFQKCVFFGLINRQTKSEIKGAKIHTDWKPSSTPAPSWQSHISVTSPAPLPADSPAFSSNGRAPCTSSSTGSCSSSWGHTSCCLWSTGSYSTKIRERKSKLFLGGLKGQFFPIIISRVNTFYYVPCSLVTTAVDHIKTAPE